MILNNYRNQTHILVKWNDDFLTHGNTLQSLFIFTMHERTNYLSCVQPAVGSPRQQCVAPLPCSLQEHQIQVARRSGPLQPCLSSINMLSHPLFHFHQLSSILPSQHWHGLMCGSSALQCLAASRLPRTTSPPCPAPTRPTCHNLFSTFFTFPSLSIFFSVSLHSSVFTADFALK